MLLPEEVSTTDPTTDTITFSTQEEEEEDDQVEPVMSSFPHRGGKSVLRRNEPTPVITSSPDTHTHTPRSAPGRDCCAIL